MLGCLIVDLCLHGIWVWYLEWTSLFPGIASALSNLPMFALTKVFPTLLQVLPPGVPFLLLAAVSGLSNLFYFFFLPETRGKTALEVKQIFLKQWIKCQLELFDWNQPRPILSSRQGNHSLITEIHCQLFLMLSSLFNLILRDNTETHIIEKLIVRNNSVYASFLF